MPNMTSIELSDDELSQEITNLTHAMIYYGSRQQLEELYHYLRGDK